MSALRRPHAKVAEARLNDHARAGDFVPLDWNAEPRFMRAPAAHTNQKVGAILAPASR